jgi:hypothetical protein
MQRRTLLRVGLAAGLALGAGAGLVALIQPGRAEGRLSTAGRALYAAVARGVLGTLVPADAAAAQTLLDAHLVRLEQAIAGMPPAVQAEIDQLTTLLASAPGRRLLVGLATPWAQASAAEVEAALQGLRHSPLSLRQQVYQALRELTNAAFFADTATWALMGYTGQRPVPHLPPA